MSPTLMLNSPGSASPQSRNLSRGRQVAYGMTADVALVTELAAELAAEREMRSLLEESLADQETAARLALDQQGWATLGSTDDSGEFTPDARRAIVGLCRSAAIGHPLIKRGLAIRVAYVWGQGVQVDAKVAGDDTAAADVVELLSRFDQAAETTLTGSQAREELELALGTDGNIWLALFTDTATGVVRPRSTPMGEIRDIITNPEDRDEPWYYLREYVAVVTETGYRGDSARTRRERRRVYHPALGYYPPMRPTVIDGIPIRWDAPMLHIAVNRLDGWRYGVPDAYAAIHWARGYTGFLTDWALLTKSLAKLSWKATGDSRSKAAAMAAKLRDSQTDPASGLQVPPLNSAVGQVATLGPGQDITAIPKTGASIDSESGRPIAAMAAAGLGLPVTMLLADPGVTGARAVAETLDRPTILEMGMRRLLWQTALERVYRHVVESAVEATAGPLTGRVDVDAWGRRRVVLAGGEPVTLEWTWPPLSDLDPATLVGAVVQADSTGKLGPLTVARQLLQTLGVRDVDGALAEVTDEQGRFVDPRLTAGAVAVDAYNLGLDPAEATR